MKNIQVCSILLLFVIMTVLSSGQSRADNAYRYFYLYRNSEAYKSNHLEENEPSPNEEGDNKDLRLYEDERDYYLDGDQGYDDSETYEEDYDDSYSSGDNNDQN